MPNSTKSSHTLENLADSRLSDSTSFAVRF